MPFTMLITSLELLVTVGRLARLVINCVPSSVPLRKAIFALIGLGRLRSLVEISLIRVVLVFRLLLRTWWTLMSPFLPRAVMMSPTGASHLPFTAAYDGARLTVCWWCV